MLPKIHPQGNGTSRRGIAIRVLVALAAIQISRPDVEIECVELDALAEKLRNFDPHMVICSLPATADLDEATGLIELSLARPTIVSVKGHHVEQSHRMGLKRPRRSRAAYAKRSGSSEEDPALTGGRRRDSDPRSEGRPPPYS